VSRLALLQEDFQDYLLHGTSAIEGHVLGSTRVPVATRLGIYGGAYGSRLAEALAGNYPVLAQLCGESEFATLAARYVQGHESAFFSIRYYGDQLPQFLATHEEYAGAAVLAELARWEWTMTVVFDAGDAVPLDPQALTQVAPQEWAQLRFGWHPSVQRLGLEWNAPQIWQAVNAGEDPPPTTLHPEPVQWLLWRQNLSTYFRSLDASEAAVLDAARAGWPFGELCELLCTQLGVEAAPTQAATLLRGWLAAGLIVSAV
jgi:hypothetical protein